MAAPERLGEPFDGIAYQSAHEPTLVSIALAATDVDPREQQDTGDPEHHDRPGSRQLSEPRRARDRGDPDDQQPDEDDEVERAVEDHGAERLAGGHPGVETEPPGAQKVSQPPGQERC